MYFSMLYLNDTLPFTELSKGALDVHKFQYIKNLNLDKPAIKIKHVGRDAIEISADKFVKDLYLISDSIHFSDNFFDLLPGRIKKIKLSQPSSDFTFKSLNVLD